MNLLKTGIPDHLTETGFTMFWWGWNSIKLLPSYDWCLKHDFFSSVIISLIIACGLSSATVYPENMCNPVNQSNAHTSEPQEQMLCCWMKSAAPPFLADSKNPSSTTWMSASLASLICLVFFFTVSGTYQRHQVGCLQYCITSNSPGIYQSYSANM